MKKINRLLSLLVIFLTTATALVGIALVLDLIDKATAVETATKLFQVLGISAVAAAVVMGVLHLNQSE